MKHSGRTSDCGCAAGRDCLCPSAPLLQIVGRRHTVPLISLLANRDAMRFHELQEAAARRLSSSTLAARLAALEQEALVIRTVNPETPPSVKYSLAGRGWRLASLLELLIQPRKTSANHTATDPAQESWANCPD
jgi:DNA-binding HxlR family transcriptional regulator